MKKFLFVFFIFFIMSIIPVFSAVEKYKEFINTALDKKAIIAERLDACEDIRKLPDTNSLTKAQLYALKIAARYKIQNIWLKSKTYYSSDKNLQRTASKILSSEGNFYLNKIQTTSNEIDIYTNVFFLGIFEYVTGNETIGTETINEAISYLKDKSVMRKKLPYLIEIYNLTLAFCENNKTTDEIVSMIKNINYKE